MSRNLLVVVAVCALIGPIIGGVLAHDPVSVVRAIGLKAKGQEREEWEKKLIQLGSALDNGITYASFGERISDLAASAAWVTAREKLPDEDPFVKSAASVISSLQRVKLIWDLKFDDREGKCHWGYYNGQQEGSPPGWIYCGGVDPESIFDDEGLKYDKEKLRSSDIDEMVKTLMTSASVKIAAAYAQSIK